MRLSWNRLSLPMTNRWATSRGGVAEARVVVLSLVAGDVHGMGETSPISRYGETVDTVDAFLARVDASRLRFDDLAQSMAYVESITPGQHAAKSAISIALYDGAARMAGKSLCSHLGFRFEDHAHLTSFSIGIASPEETALKVRSAGDFPVLKLKLGSVHDKACFSAARAAAPATTFRVDANEAWRDKEHALAMITWLAEDGNVEFIEQPMPAGTPSAELAWLRARSPLPLIADESFHDRADVARCAEGFHGVNAKLSKTSGIAGAVEALSEARRQGLSTMLGCMVESSIAISAAAHLAELCDYLDLDGNLLLAADPYEGVACLNGRLSFAQAREPLGIRVRPRFPAGAGG